ncbi:MAG: hypothetical protein LBT76_02270 [Tannerella sp.]|nr:hypothetical protein [Tannerella sp.]
MKINNLDIVFASTTSAFEVLNTVNGHYLTGISNREAAFEAVKKILSRIYKTAEILSLNPSALKAIKELIRKLRGERAVAKKAQGGNAGDGASKAVYRSVSQLSFDQRIEHFSELVALLQGLPEYAPNEADLTVAHLGALLENMRATNLAVVDAHILLTNARNSRNHLLYAAETGLVDVALDVKKYILAAFGAGSDEYEEVKKITFRKNI